jgi:hypothetical protein
VPKAKGIGMRVQWIAFFCGLIITVAAAAEPSAQDWIDANSCSIEVTIGRSRDHYVIAVVQHLGKARHDAGNCVETLKIVQLLAARTPDGRPIGSTIDVMCRGATGAVGADPTGVKILGVYLPDPRGNFYLGAVELTPAEAEEVANFEQAAKIAVAAPAGAPECLKPFPQSIIGSHEINSK